MEYFGYVDYYDMFGGVGDGESGCEVVGGFDVVDCDFCFVG